ncbi:hypothetical protein IMCC13023_02650 [Candidatus Aquiluna sp. IMCC13023]|nr:hypothetical protein IMCC13023_02650 [Candidatus Aquiluna sp. IMCC13023]
MNPQILSRVSEKLEPSGAFDKERHWFGWPANMAPNYRCPDGSFAS